MFVNINNFNCQSLIHDFYRTQLKCGLTQSRHKVLQSHQTHSLLKLLLQLLYLYETSLKCMICFIYTNYVVIMIDEAAYIYPADLQKAKKHRLATRIFKGTMKELQQGQRCQCCHRHVGVYDNGAPVNCDYKPAQKLSFLGSGVPLLFYFTQNAGMLLICLLAVFCVYALDSNWKGNSCDCGDSYSSRITKFSVINKLGDSRALSIQTILCAAFIIIYFFFNQWLVRRIRKKNVKCDEVINSPSDYSIIITHLPPNTTQEEILQLIQDHASTLSKQELQRTNSLHVQKVILSYGLKEFLKISKKRLKQFLKIKKKQPKTPIPKEPIIVNLQTASFAIVIFQYKLSKELFLQYQNLNKSCGGVFHGCFYSSLEFAIRGQVVDLARAPQPDDIIWQNADVSRPKMVFHSIIAYICGISLLLGGGYLQYFLQVTQNSIQGSTNQQLFSLVNSASVSLVNAIILQFLRIVTKLEGQKTKTTQNRSLLIKISLYSFFNCGVFYSLAYVLAASLQKFTLDGYFAHQVVNFMTMNAILPNVINLIFNKFQIPNSIIRKLTASHARTQRNANELYQFNEPDFSVQYGYIIQTLWLTCFYSPFVPVVVIASLVGLLFFYYTEAQLFRTSYKIPNMLSFDLTRMACHLVDYCGLFLSLGHALILLYMKYTVKAEITLVELISLIVSFIFSVVLVIIPSFKLNRAAYKLPHKYDDQKEYADCLIDFQVTYEETNPLFDSTSKKRNYMIHYQNFQRIELQNKYKSQQTIEMQTKNTSKTPFLKEQPDKMLDQENGYKFDNRNL